MKSRVKNSAWLAQCVAAQSKAPEQSAAGLRKSTHWKRSSSKPRKEQRFILYLTLFNFERQKLPCARGFSASNHFIASLGISSAWVALASHHILHLLRGLAQYQDSLECSLLSVLWPHVWALNTILIWHRCPHVCVISCRGQFINIFWQRQARYSVEAGASNIPRTWMFNKDNSDHGWGVLPYADIPMLIHLFSLQMGLAVTNQFW